MVLLSILFVVLSASILSAASPAPLDLSMGGDGLAVSLSTVGSSIATRLRRRRGRPRKFEAPSRAVTLTLPESVLETLASIHPDPSHAVAQLAKRKARRKNGSAAELVVYGHRAVISIRPSASLQQRDGIELVPLPDGRALISFVHPKSIADLELMLNDALDDSTLTADDREVFESIVAILKDARRSSDIDLQRRSIIVIESTRAKRTNGTKASRG